MKIHQNGTVFLMIRLPATMVWVKQLTAACDEPFGHVLRVESLSRVEYRISNDEGWCRFAKSFLKQTEYIYSTFDVGRSMFDVHQFLFRSAWTLTARGNSLPSKPCTPGSVQIATTAQTLHIMHMGVLAGFDITGGASDNAVVFSHRFPFSDGPQCKLVAVGDILRYQDNKGLLADAHRRFLSGRYVLDSSGHIVLFFYGNSCSFHDYTNHQRSAALAPSGFQLPATLMYLHFLLAAITQSSNM